MTTIKVFADSVFADMESGAVTLNGVDCGDVIAELGIDEVLETIDYSDILRFVSEQEKIRKEEDER